MRKRQAKKDENVMRRDQTMFLDTLNQLKDEHLRLVIIHRQISWCRKTMRKHHDDTRIISYCKNWLSTLRDALKSIS